MFTHNIDPVLLTLGPVEIRYYGLFYALGFLIIWWTLQHYKDHIKITKDQAADLAFWLIIGVVVGSRLYSVFVWNPSYYLANPIKIFYLWEGGLAFHGGLLGILLAAYLYCKKHKLKFWKLADLLSIPALVALALGRLANFINGELYGPTTNVAWCVKFQGVEGCRHPYQLYSALKHVIIAGILALLNKRKHKDGFLFWMLVALTGITRFFLDYYREDVLYAGLSTGQWSSVVMVIIAIGVLVKWYRKDLTFK